MKPPLRTSLIVALLLSLASAHAQQPADPSGHWEGAIQTPDRNVNIEVDLAKNAGDQLAGTISIPEQDVKGLPFQKVTVDGRSVAFVARTDQPFSGTLSPDGKSIEAHLSVNGFSVPVSLIRTGDARIEAPEKSAAIPKELEGTWKGAITTEGQQFHIILTLANQGDGSAIGTAIDVDEGGLQVPVNIVQADSKITLQFKALGASFVGALNKDTGELAGTYTHGSLVLPLTFQHATAGR